MERENLKSRLGFILLSAGCAIGIGNVWKFPYMAGQGGGGAFVLFYLIFLVILGLPIMTMEFAVGRASKKSPVKAYQALEKPGQKWHIHGYFTLAGCYLLMMFYTTVAGWMLHYFYMTATGKLSGLSADAVADQFTRMLADPGVMMFWMVLVVVIGVVICAGGLQNGLERVTKVMMIALLAIMVVLAINSFFMEGAKEGLKFYLVPDFGRMQEVGVVSTLVGAMNQAFFKFRHWCHGDLWKLHRQGSFSDGRVRQSCGTGYFRGNYRRTDHFPRLLYLWGGSDFRAQPDLYYFAESFRKYALRPPVGKLVLPVHGVRSSVYSTGSI